MTRFLKVLGRRRERGSAVVELAVATPLLLVTTIGLVDFGRAGYETVQIENAAQAGASYGARTIELAADTTGIRNAALADVGNIDKSGITVASTQLCECSNGSSINCANTCPGGETPAMFLRVEVKKTFQTLLKYPGLTGQIAFTREVEFQVR